MKRRFLITLILLLIILFFLFKIIWKSPPFYTSYSPKNFDTKILTMEEYGEFSEFHERPFVVQFEVNNGALCLYGSEHTNDPEDPQIVDIKNKWESFKPSVALVEGRLGFLFPGFMNPINEYGEMGTVYKLAMSESIDVYSWEPPREMEIKFMLDFFLAERVALFYVLRPYFSNLRFGRPESPDDFVEEFRKKRIKYQGLENTLTSIASIDSIWRKDFYENPDWREVSDEFGLPGYLKELQAKSNSFRDKHLANVIVDLVEKRNRVFVIAGSSHAVKLEKTLRDYFNR